MSSELILAMKGGYLAFDARIPSNYRVLWIDLPGVVLGLGELPTAMPKLSA